MQIKLWLRAVAAGCLTALMTSCATTPGAPFKSGALEEGTLVMAVVVADIVRDEIVNPKDKDLRGWYSKLREAGIKDEDIVDGSEIFAITSCYGHNSIVGCAHPSNYLAHVPPELQGKLVPFKKSEAKKERGDIVKIELRITPSGNVIGIVKEVYRKNDDWRDCSFKPLGYRALSVLSPLGPPQGMWIDCPGLEQEGWQRYRLLGSPPPGIFEWLKEPSRPAK